jgi:hypothetical protein
LAERERAEDMSGEDAAWRDLVVRFDLPSRPDGTVPPWPEREDLPAARHQQPAASAESDAGTGSGPAAAIRVGTGEDSGAGHDLGTGKDSGAGDDLAANEDSGSAKGQGPAPGASPDPRAAGGSGGNGDRPALGQPGPPAASEPGRPAAEAGPPEASIPDRARVIKPVVPAQLPAADEGEDHYVPPAPPPLPALDPVAKGAWAGLFGGPAYLLVATTAGWVLPGWATFGAVAAFVGGFAVLVIRMGDKPSRGSGPDSGAVL